jgi:hypothetical protein
MKETDQPQLWDAFRLGAYLSRNAYQTVSAPPDDGCRAAAANYVATLSANLAAIARRHELDTLGYILDMARIEAENKSRYGGHNGH